MTIPIPPPALFCFTGEEVAEVESLMRSSFHLGIFAGVVGTVLAFVVFFYVKPRITEYFERRFKG